MWGLLGSIFWKAALYFLTKAEHKKAGATENALVALKIQTERVQAANAAGRAARDDFDRLHGDGGNSD